MIKVNLGVRGAYGEQNFGDDALMLFLYKWSKDKNLDVKFIGKKNSYVYDLIPHKKYILKDNSHKYHFNKLILGGGTQFFSFQKSPKAESKIKLLFSNPSQFFNKILNFIEKKLINTKANYTELFAVGIGLGPFIENSKQEELAKTQISEMQGVFVRDSYSYSFSKPLNESSYLGTDICFLSGLYDFSSYKNTSKSIKNIGIIVRDWNYSESGILYLQNIIKQIEKISEENYDLTFILFKDEVQCEELIGKTGYNTLKWNPNRSQIEDFIEDLSFFDLFISARFHGVIFGALLGIPSIAIEIEPKLKVTKELLGNGVVVWEQPFNSDLLQLIENVNYLDAVESINKAVEKQEIVAQQMFEKLYELIA